LPLFEPANACIFALGDSAGAHLAMTLLLALREKSLPQVQGAALIYGMYARRFDTWSHHTYGDGSFGLSSDKMRWFWDKLVPTVSGANTSITDMLDVSLETLPPLALFAAECDCLLEDTLDLRESCKRQDHVHSFDLFRGATHGFMHLCSVYEGTRTAMAVVAGRLKDIRP
jgi:acetyl esterase